MAQRLAKSLLLLGLALASACASGGDPYADERAAEVELTVVNERQAVVTAYVQWRRGSPTRLAELAGDSRTTIRIPVRGQELRVFFVGPGRSPGDPREPEYASARAGDHFEWRLRADRTVFYLRHPG